MLGSRPQKGEARGRRAGRGACLGPRDHARTQRAWGRAGGAACPARLAAPDAPAQGGDRGPAEGSGTPRRAGGAQEGGGLSGGAFWVLFGGFPHPPHAALTVALHPGSLQSSWLMAVLLLLLLLLVGLGAGVLIWRRRKRKRKTWKEGAGGALRGVLRAGAERVHRSGGGGWRRQGGGAGAPSTPRTPITHLPCTGGPTRPLAKTGSGPASPAMASEANDDDANDDVQGGGASSHILLYMDPTLLRHPKVGQREWNRPEDVRPRKSGSSAPHPAVDSMVAVLGCPPRARSQGKRRGSRLTRSSGRGERGRVRWHLGPTAERSPRPQCVGQRWVLTSTSGSPQRSGPELWLGQEACEERWLGGPACLGLSMDQDSSQSLLDL